MDNPAVSSYWGISLMCIFLTLRLREIKEAIEGLKKETPLERICMARTRNLKPSFFTNDSLAEIDPLGRLLFQGLWCIADRDGRLLDRPKKIKVEILPFDDCDVEQYLKQLSARGFIERYVVDEVHYIQIVKFTKHQHPHPRETASEIPANPEPHLGIAEPCKGIAEPCKGIAEPCKGVAEPGLVPYILVPSTFNPSTLNSTPVNGKVKIPLADLESIYVEYPRKIGKAAALKAISSALKRLRDGEFKGEQIQIPEALERLKKRVILFAASPAGQRGNFTPHPATWFNRSSYLDDPDEWMQDDAKTTRRN
jgi:hypothetical protein